MGEEIPGLKEKLHEKDIYALFVDFAQVVDLSVWFLPARDERAHLSLFSRAAAIRTIRDLRTSTSPSSYKVYDPVVSPVMIFEAFHTARLSARCGNTEPDNIALDSERMYYITGKGMHVLEWVLGYQHPLYRHLLHQQRAGLSSTVDPPSSAIVCPKLLHLDRDPKTNEIVFSSTTISALFQRAIGSGSNVVPLKAWDPTGVSPISDYYQYSRGVPQRPLHLQDTQAPTDLLEKYRFTGKCFVQWMSNFTTVLNVEEAITVGRWFVKSGLIQQDHPADLITLRMHLDAPILEIDKGFAPSSLVYYGIANSAPVILSPDPEQVNGQAYPRPPSTKTCTTDPRKDLTSLAELNAIIDCPQYRQRFQTFLRRHALEEHLLFWLDTQTFIEELCYLPGIVVEVKWTLLDLKKASSELRTELGDSGEAELRAEPLLLYMDNPGLLHTKCDDIYSRARELSIDIGKTSVRQEFETFLQDFPWILDEMDGKGNPDQGDVLREEINPIWVYFFVIALSKIRDAICNDLASRMIPQFRRTPDYISLKSKNQPGASDDLILNTFMQRFFPASTLRKPTSTTGAWMTISQYGLDQAKRATGLS